MGFFIEEEKDGSEEGGLEEAEVEAEEVEVGVESRFISIQLEDGRVLHGKQQQDGLKQEQEKQEKQKEEEKDEEEEERVVPILSHTGTVLLPRFSRLDSLRPPPWSVFHRPRRSCTGLTERSRSAEGGAGPGAGRGGVEGGAGPGAGREGVKGGPPRPHSEADALFRELELLGSLPAGSVFHSLHSCSV